ncbi:hypothetical protein KFL_004350020 [Klebsormidium nitens]|uniref:IPT/TIG domain-containing protein n=1 Tax=Klebsormidium nitens TaxID=105231 RepID=A0A1Y1IET8_KLENI|nr:hypothetical protein KFL_004350020 [Klebsormidium nitens]|eukprot:GAQ88512.1 hypothetical protein KFL_004350020 [Klebsormidium nitens]
MSASLANISLNAIPLLPPFDPSVQVYSANVSADVSQVNVSIVPGVLGSSIKVNGTLLQYGCANGTDCNNTATLRISYAGLNTYAITVDSPNGLNQTVYQILIYSAPATDICRRRPFPPPARTAACINGVATFAGPTTGGTRVGVHYPYGPLPSAKAAYSSVGIARLKPPTCAFGETLTVGSYAWEGDYITCYSPPQDEPRTVELRISFDGNTFTASGLTFSYYAPFEALSVTTEPAALYVGAIFKARVSLTGPVFGPAFTDFAGADQTGRCQMPGSISRASYVPANGTGGPPSLYCEALVPYYFGAGQYSLQVSLNEWDYVPVPQPLSFAPFNASGSGYNRLPNAGVRWQSNVPYNESLCLSYPVGPDIDDATLSQLACDQGGLSPAFDPSVFAYTASVPSNVTQVFLTLAPAVIGATITINGSLLAVACADGFLVNSTITLPIAYAGANNFVIEVTALDGIHRALYSVSVFSAPEPGLVACPKAYASQPRSACMQSIVPVVGPISGGTTVTIRFPYNQLPLGPVNWWDWWSNSNYGSGVKKPVCRFGRSLVTGAYGTDGTSITCVAPPWDETAPSRTVALSFSLDGVSFSTAGANFHYHVPFTAAAVTAPRVPVSLGSLFEALVPLDNAPFAADFTDYAGISATATCDIQAYPRMPAVLIPPGPNQTLPVFRCVGNSQLGIEVGTYNLHISLTGQDSVTVRKPIVFSAPGGPPVGDTGFYANAQPRPLPPSPGFCVSYLVGATSANVSLSALAFSEGLFPAFDPGLRSYSSRVAFNVTEVTIIVLPSVVGGSVSVNGRPLGVTCVNKTIAHNVFTAAVPYAGNNRFTVEVTAPDGINRAAYTIDVYADLAPVPAVCQKPYAPQFTTACLQKIYPGVGPTTGGTLVQLQFSSGSFSYLYSVPTVYSPGDWQWRQLWTVKQPVCAFGNQTVPGTLNGDSAVTCTSPPAANGAPETVALTFSLDGRTFSSTGATFTYHTPYQAVGFDGLPSTLYLGKAYQVHIRLQGLLLPDAFTNFDLISLTTMCQFEGMRTGAAFLPGDGNGSDPMVSCAFLAPGYFQPGPHSLSLSLTGQDFATVLQSLVLTTPNDTSSYYYWWSYLPGPYYNQGLQLPSSAGYCVSYSSAPDALNASLTSLDLGGVALSPPFSPSILQYTASVTSALDAVNVTLLPAALGARVRASGGVLEPDCASGAPGGNALVFPVQYVGKNNLTIEVTSASGLSQAVYYVNVYAAPADRTCQVKPYAPSVPRSACLQSIFPSSGPASGRTRVTFNFPCGQLPSNMGRDGFWDVKLPICSFGGRQVTGMYDWGWGCSLWCSSPAWDQNASAESVEVTFSFNGGRTFSKAGAIFSYYIPFNPTLSSVPDAIVLGTTFYIEVSLSGPVFGANFTGYDAFAPACRLPNLWGLVVPATFITNGTTPALGCTLATQYYMNPGSFILEVSLNGYDFVACPERLNIVPSNNTNWNYNWVPGWQSPPALPSAPGRCVPFVGDPENVDASLLSIVVGNETVPNPVRIFPMFFQADYMQSSAYFGTVPAAADEIMLTAVPAIAGVNVTLDGVPLALSCENGELAGNSISAAIPHSGLNWFRFYVTALDGIHELGYRLDIFAEPPLGPGSCPRPYKLTSQTSCLQRLSPLVGPVAGGTQVFVGLSGGLPSFAANYYWGWGSDSGSQFKPPVCRFGSQAVNGTYTQGCSSGWCGGGVLCDTPAVKAPMGGQTVPVTISFDGATFTARNATFTYYAPFTARAVTNLSSPPCIGVPFEAVVPLDGLLFPPDFTYSDLLRGSSSPASCDLEGTLSVAEYWPPTAHQIKPEIRCTTMAQSWLSPGPHTLRVSLNGRDYVAVQTPLSFSAANESVNGWVPGPSWYQNGLQLDSSDPGYCLSYLSGPGSANTTLASVSLAPANLTSDFTPDVRNYAARVSWDVSQVAIRVAASVVGAAVRINGSPVDVRCSNRTLSNNTFPAPILFTGTNAFTIEVTAPNRISRSLYTLNIESDPAPVPGPCQKPYAPQITTACLQQIFPGVGPARGGTQVRLQFPYGQLPLGYPNWWNWGSYGTDAKLPLCAFGDLVVNGSYGYDGTSIVCPSPAWPASEPPETVAVSFSLDGAVFSTLGATFTYYAPFAPGTVTGLPPTLYTGAAYQASIPLGKTVFPTDFTDYDLVGLSATCNLDGTTSAAQILPEVFSDGSLALSCTVFAPWYYQPGPHTLQVSLDGMNYSPLPAPIFFTAPNETTYGWPYYRTPNWNQGRQLYGPGYCTGYRTGPTAADSSLGTLAVDQGALLPDFNPATRAYAINVTADVTEINLTLLPGAPRGAVVEVNGVPVNISCAGNETAGNVFSAAVHYVGLNAFVITVTAPDNIHQTAYRLDVYAARAGNVCAERAYAPAARAAACMQGVAPSLGPVTGGTRVAVHFPYGQLPLGSFRGYWEQWASFGAKARRPVCTFGDQRVEGSYGTEGTTILCVSPPLEDQSQPVTVDLTFSLDGRVFTRTGATFTYYANFQPAMVAALPSSVAVSDLVTAVIPLPSPLFDATFSDFARVNSSAACLLQPGSTSAAAYFSPDSAHDTPTLRCLLKLWMGPQPGQCALQVALNGQDYTPVLQPLMFSVWTGNSENWWQRPPAPGNQVWPLPAASTDPCISYEIGAPFIDATLANLTLVAGVWLSPDFQADVLSYSISVPSTVNEVTLTVTPNVVGQTVLINGAELFATCANGSLVGNVFKAATPYIATNNITIEVVAQNGIHRYLYTVLVQSQPSNSPALCQKDSAPSVGSACLQSIFPKAGPVGGGTRVVLRFPQGQLPLAAGSYGYSWYTAASTVKNPVCAFGGQKVQGYYGGDGSTIYCNAPAWDPTTGARTVPVWFSFDGSSFTIYGPKYTYYDAVTVTGAATVPASPTIASYFTATVTLSGDLSPEDPSTLSPACRFLGYQYPATVSPAVLNGSAPTLRCVCVAWPYYPPSEFDLEVSLNGQDFVLAPSPVSLGPQLPDSSWSGFNMPTVFPQDVPGHYPPGVCLTYRSGLGAANATLASLSLDSGYLNPAFNPGQTYYWTSLPTDVAEVTLAFEPGTKGATVTANGTPISATCAEGAVANNTFPVSISHSAPTQVSVVVLAPDGISERVYYVTIYSEVWSTPGGQPGMGPYPSPMDPFAPPAMSPPTPFSGPARVYVRSYGPGLSSYGGGIKLSVVLERPAGEMAPHAEGWYYCQFDSVVVFADSFQDNPSVPNVWTVTFVVPPLPRGNMVAKLAISEDGFNFQDFGVFQYHEPLHIASFAPAMGSTAGRREVQFSVASSLLIYSSATAERLQPACKFGNITVPGTFHQPYASEDSSPHISCVGPASQPGFARLAVSLNGQEWAPVTGRYHFVQMLEDPDMPGRCFYGHEFYDDCDSPYPCFEGAPAMAPRPQAFASAPAPGPPFTFLPPPGFNGTLSEPLTVVEVLPAAAGAYLQLICTAPDGQPTVGALFAAALTSFPEGDAPAQPLFVSYPADLPGDYAIDVSVRSGGVYSFSVYRCFAPACEDVQTGALSSPVAVFQGSFSVVPGPLSHNMTTASLASGAYAGAAVNITIRARDANGLLRTQGGDSTHFAARIEPAVAWPPNVTDHGDGTYLVSFVPVLVGEHTVTLLIDEEPFAFFKFDTLLDSRDAAKFFLAGPRTAAAGQNLTFSVRPLFDHYLTVNSFSINVTSTNSLKAVASLDDASCRDGTARASVDCVFTLNATQSGTYAVSVYLSSEEVTSSPASFVILPGPPSVLRSSVTGSAQAAAGDAAAYAVRLMDFFGNAITADVVLEFSGPTPASVPQLIPAAYNGSQAVYTAKAFLSARGSYNITAKAVVAADNGGGSLGVSSLPFGQPLIVKPGPLNATRVRESLQGPALQDAAAGAPLSIIAYPLDAYNNPLGPTETGGVAMRVIVRNGSDVTLVDQALSWADGDTVLKGGRIFLTAAGAYNVSVVLSIGDSPSSLVYNKSITVTAAEWVLAQTRVFGLASVRAGDLGTFQVQLRDAYGNAAPGDASLFNTSYLGLLPDNAQKLVLGSDMTVKSGAQAGLFTFSYRGTVAGQYGIHLALRMESVPGVDALGNLVITPGFAASVTSTVRGTGLQDGMALNARSLYLTVYDT